MRKPAAVPGSAAGTLNIAKLPPALLVIPCAPGVTLVSFDVPWKRPRNSMKGDHSRVLPVLCSRGTVRQFAKR